MLTLSRMIYASSCTFRAVLARLNRTSGLARAPHTGQDSSRPVYAAVRQRGDAKRRGTKSPRRVQLAYPLLRVRQFSAAVLLTTARSGGSMTVSTTVSTNSERVTQHTNEHVNDEIRRETKDNVVRVATRGRHAIGSGTSSERCRPMRLRSCWWARPSVHSWTAAFSCYRRSLAASFCNMAFRVGALRSRCFVAWACVPFPRSIKNVTR